MPWFYRYRLNQRHMNKCNEMRHSMLLLLLLCCSIDKCPAFSPHMSKQVSLLHASTSEGKTTTLEIESKPIKSILSSESIDKEVRKQYNKRNGNGQQRGYDGNFKNRKSARQRCSKAQNAKRKIRYLYSKAR